MHSSRELCVIIARHVVISVDSVNACRFLCSTFVIKYFKRGGVTLFLWLTLCCLILCNIMHSLIILPSANGL